MVGNVMSNEQKTRYIVILMYSIIAIGIVMYISSKYYEKSTRCGSMEKNYKDSNFYVKTGGNNSDYLPYFKDFKCKDDGLIFSRRSNNVNYCFSNNQSADANEAHNIEKSIICTHMPIKL